MGGLQGAFADLTGPQLDGYAIRSTLRAKNASLNGSFDWEVVPVTVQGRKGVPVVDKDEGPFSVNLERAPTLKPASEASGTVTAADSSSISDGAAALVLTRESMAAKLGLIPVARILGHAAYAGLPEKFPSAPAGAIRQRFKRTRLSADEIDLFEINEAFAVVPMAAAHDLRLDLEKVDIHGGAYALGHPIGASGARILVTLPGALKQTGGKKGIASLCIGGGEATALAVEILRAYLAW